METNLYGHATKCLYKTAEEGETRLERGRRLQAWHLSWLGKMVSKVGGI